MKFPEFDSMRRRCWKKTKVLEIALVMWFSIKQMVGACIAAAFVLSLTVPTAHANSQNTRLAREEIRQGSGQYQRQQRIPRAAQRHNAQRGDGQDLRPQRLSPEERRQLRRDIQDAGREIYPQRRR